MSLGKFFFFFFFLIYLFLAYFIFILIMNLLGSLVCECGVMISQFVIDGMEYVVLFEIGKDNYLLDLILVDLTDFEYFS